MTWMEDDFPLQLGGFLGDPAVNFPEGMFHFTPIFPQSR